MSGENVDAAGTDSPSYYKTTLRDRLRWKLQSARHTARKAANAIARPLGYIHCERDSNIISHARNEFRAAGWGKKDDDMQSSMCDCLVDLLGVMAAQGHSGFSASYLIANLTPLMKYEPITPLTGEDWEWVEVGTGSWQNSRCYSVFKDADRFDGQAYHSDAIVFRDPDGSCFTNADSRKVITFPYMPKREYVDRPPVAERYRATQAERERIKQIVRETRYVNPYNDPLNSREEAKAWNRACDVILDRMERLKP